MSRSFLLFMFCAVAFKKAYVLGFFLIKEPNCKRIILAARF